MVSLLAFDREVRKTERSRMDKLKEKPEKPHLEIGYPPRRFGLIAMEKGFINTNDLWEALVRQKAEKAGKIDPRTIGSILNELGRLTDSQIDEVLEALKGEAESSQASIRLRKSPGREKGAKTGKKE